MINISKTYDIHKKSDLVKFATFLAKQLQGIKWIYLDGVLGSGKTTFSKYFIAAKGYRGRVTSPTYAIMQDYHTPTGCVVHCDLYRLTEPEDIYEIGLLEMAEDNRAIVLLEWASKAGREILPPADLHLNFIVKRETRIINVDINRF